MVTVDTNGKTSIVTMVIILLFIFGGLVSNLITKL